MAVSDNRVTFWFGCNMLRHAEMIRLSIMLLERAGYDVRFRGRPEVFDRRRNGAIDPKWKSVGRPPCRLACGKWRNLQLIASCTALTK